MSLLNFGCGGAFHPEWVNLDAAPADPRVTAHDLRRGFPFSAGSFDAAYGSHVLEHLEPDAASRLLRDCHRILRPGGILRIVVPDLEAIARLYLDFLERAASGDGEAAFRYDWMMLELYDQAVRTMSGGRMAVRLSGKLTEHQARFIESRIGAEAMGAVAMGVPAAPQPLSRALRRLRAALTVLRRHIAQALVLPVLGHAGTSALRAGLFRESGEVHQWMYDRYSLRRAMEEAGFGEIRHCAADESGIPGFARFGLETRDHQPRRPDSLYMEGKKLGQP
jgi:predicted SAM-dependent methyltransferase